MFMLMSVCITYSTCVQYFESSLRANWSKCKMTKKQKTNQHHLHRKEGGRPNMFECIFQCFCFYSSVLLSVLYLNTSMSVCMCVKENMSFVNECIWHSFEHWERIGIKVVNQSCSVVPNYVMKWGRGDFVRQEEKGQKVRKPLNSISQSPLLQWACVFFH